MRDDAYVLVLSVAEAHLARLDMGDAAEVRFDGVAGQTFDAVVTAIAPIVTVGRGTVNVTMTLTTPPENLRPYMAARVSLCGCSTGVRLSENG